MINLPQQKIKDLLVNAGIVKSEDFDSVAQDAERKQQHVVDILVSKNVLTEDYFYELLSKALNIPRVNFQTVDIDKKVLNLIPEETARKKKVLVFKQRDDGSYDVAMESPTDLEIINFLKIKLGGQVNIFLASDNDLEKGFALYSETQAKDFKKIIEDRVQESLRSRVQNKNLEEAAQDLPVVDLVDNIFNYAYALGTSDIHIEALEGEVLFRFRVDGIMREILRVPKDILPAMIARIKILSGLRIDEHNRPQDGRFRFKVGDNALDVRVSVMPTFYGEKVVMRLLEASQKPLSFQELGMLDDTAKALQESSSRGYGMILICGPTGSGKSTTLYSVLSQLNDPKVNIITVEDPVEYNMRYVNQVQVNEAAGITFANGLRSILRQDPDIIMVGEMRDGETANIGVQAALTGHLVLSSLHTNDAPTAIPRLLDLGVKPFLVSAVITAVLAQRLVRKIHTNCIESYPVTDDIRDAIMAQLKIIGADTSKVRIPKNLYRGKGCDQCNHTGYKGRMGIFEIITVDDDIKELINSHDFTLETITKTMREKGMLTMFEDGLRKVERGTTTIDELFRVIRE